MLHWIMVKSRKAHVLKEWPLHMSFRVAEVSIPWSQFSNPGISHESVLGLAGSCHSQPHQLFQMPTQHYQLSPCTLSSACMAASLLFLPFENGRILREAEVAPPSLPTARQNLSHMAALFTTDWHGCLLLPHYPMVDRPFSLRPPSF